MLMEQSWEVYQIDGGETVALWWGKTSQEALFAAARALGTTNPEEAKRKYGVRPLKRKTKMTIIQIKQSTASKSRDIRALQEKEDSPVKEVRIKWNSVLTICVERQRKVRGRDMAAVEFGLASGNYFQCWIKNEDVPVLMQKWDNELKLNGR